MGAGKAVGSEQVYVYRIDRDDKIVSVSNNWTGFARENDWSASSPVGPANVVGRSIWQFFSGIETQHLYQILVEQARKHQKPLCFSFRCDSPRARRMFDLTITPLEDGAIEFQSALRKVEPRGSVSLLSADVERALPPVQICSTCKKVALDGHEWVEADEAVRRLGLLETSPQPQLTHGLCPACLQAAMREIRKNAPPAGTDG